MIKYYCDWCAKEVKEDDLGRVRVSVDVDLHCNVVRHGMADEVCQDYYIKFGKLLLDATANVKQEVKAK